MDIPGVLRGKPLADGFLEYAGSFPGLHGDQSATGIAVAFGAGEFEPKHTTLLGELVFENSKARGVGASEGDVEAAIIVVVEEGEGARVLRAVDTTDERLIGETVGRGEEKAVALVSAEGIAPKSRAAGLALFDAELEIEQRGFPMLGRAKCF